MILGTICVLLLAIECVHSKEPRTCRIFRDKYDRQSAASRNYRYGQVWPGNVIPYEIESDYTDEERDVIKAAMKHIEEKVCVKWVPRNGEFNYVAINDEHPLCFANLAYQHLRGRHILNLQRWDGEMTCLTLGDTAHEMLHIMGFDHEHSRPDRNDFVKVDWENLEHQCLDGYFRALLVGSAERLPECDPQSYAQSYDNCYVGYRTETFGMDYDYGSIMHYSLTMCAAWGGNTMDTIKKVPIGITIGQRDGMSDLDVQKSRAKYGCDGRTTTTRKPSIECKDGSKECPQMKSQCKKDRRIYDLCPVTCDKCKKCVDAIELCKDMADQCGGNDLVDDNCPMTCGTCPA